MDVGLESMKYKIQSQYYISPLSFEGRLCKMVALISGRLRRQVTLITPPGLRLPACLRATASDQCRSACRKARCPSPANLNWQKCGDTENFDGSSQFSIQCNTFTLTEWQYAFAKGCAGFVLVWNWEMGSVAIREDILPKIMSVWRSENHSFEFLLQVNMILVQGKGPIISLVHKKIQVHCKTLF